LTTQVYDKKFVALVQLETALRLFSEEDDFFSALTLAGAAEEILGLLVIGKGGETSLDSLKNAASAMYQHLFGESIDPSVFINRANRARNSLKHLGSPKQSTVALDVREEAVDMLDRAIDNYWTLEESLTPAMEQFIRSSREPQPDGGES
jgi:hypothetical protein